GEIFGGMSQELCSELLVQDTGRPLKRPIWSVALGRLAPTYYNVRLRSSIFAASHLDLFEQPVRDFLQSDKEDFYEQSIGARGDLLQRYQ
ncbi:MAG TPA: hypothetical protein VFK25_11535, partial [Candidatus Binatia bacterium]|nr:hypothetical protein [Candidatus Binatia bacterium]